jgi:hypothetical protein
MNPVDYPTTSDDDNQSTDPGLYQFLENDETTIKTIQNRSREIITLFKKLPENIEPTSAEDTPFSKPVRGTSVLIVREETAGRTTDLSMGEADRSSSSSYFVKCPASSVSSSSSSVPIFLLLIEDVEL